MDDKPSHKQRTRARILDEAAKAMRAEGSEGISVAAIMKRAGLTHGGFYAHFDSRDDLVAHAVDRMFQDSRALVAEHLEGREPAAGLASLIDAYLSDERRLSPERGCPLPALSGEVGRMPPPARERFQEGVARFRNSVASALRMLGEPEADMVAGSVVAELVGAMSLARAASDDEEARRLLEASRSALKRRLGLIGRSRPPGGPSDQGGTAPAQKKPWPFAGL